MLNIRWLIIQPEKDYMARISKKIKPINPDMRPIDYSSTPERSWDNHIGSWVGDGKVVWRNEFFADGNIKSLVIIAYHKDLQVFKSYRLSNKGFIFWGNKKERFKEVLEKVLIKISELQSTKLKALTKK